MLSTACFPVSVPDHLVVPMTVQRMSSAMCPRNGSKLPWAISVKMCCMSCLLSAVPISPSGAWCAAKRLGDASAAVVPTV